MKKTNNSFNKKLIKTQLSNFLKSNDVVEAAAVVTVDGHLVEKIESRKYPLNRVTTMSSSMMSLADTMTGELKMGNCKNLILENEKGIVVVMHINKTLVLLSTTHNTDTLGMLVSSTRACAELIRTIE